MPQQPVFNPREFMPRTTPPRARGTGAGQALHILQAYLEFPSRLNKDTRFLSLPKTRTRYKLCLLYTSDAADE